MSDDEPKPNSTPPYHRFEMENTSVLNDPLLSVHGQKGSKRSNAMLKWKLVMAALVTAWALTVALLLGYHFYALHNLALADEKKEVNIEPEHGKHLDQFDKRAKENAQLRAAVNSLEGQIAQVKFSTGIVNYGRIVSKARFGPGNHQYCVDSPLYSPGLGELHAYACPEIEFLNSYDSYYWVMNVDGRISNDDPPACLMYGAFGSFPGQPMVAMFDCIVDPAADASPQQWSYNSTSFGLRHIKANACLTLGDKCEEEEEGRRCDLTMAACNPTDERQEWIFVK